MVLSDINVYRNILGSLMKTPVLLLEYQDINPIDFDIKVARIIFITIKKMFEEGKEKIVPYEVDQEVSNFAASSVIYKANNGLEFLQDCYEYSSVENFKANYTRLKKLSLLRVLKKNNYNISRYYQDNFNSIQEEQDAIELFDSSSLSDILDSIDADLSKIREDFLTNGCKKGDAADGVFQLLEDLKKSPNIGPALHGEIFNVACRGARQGCYYLKSASTNSGKTRSSVFDACKLAYPCYYDLKEETFINCIDNEGVPIQPVKVLFIVTEMEKEEIQSIILAHLARVNEEHILTNNYNIGERDRVLYAAKIMEKYKDYFFIEEISDPNLENVEAVIRRYASIENVKAVFFDYLHSTPSMVAQFSENGLREDVILMMMSNKLKQIAKDYNIFIFSATQVNASAMGNEGDFKNESCIRGF